MFWYADINLKSGKNIIVEKLQSINDQYGADNTTTKITDYNDFFLQAHHRLSFVGEKSIAVLSSEEISYVELKQCN